MYSVMYVKGLFIFYFVLCFLFEWSQCNIYTHTHLLKIGIPSTMTVISQWSTNVLCHVMYGVMHMNKNNI